MTKSTSADRGQADAPHTGQANGQHALSASPPLLARPSSLRLLPAGPPMRQPFAAAASARIVTVGARSAAPPVEVRLLGPPRVGRTGERGRVRHPQGGGAARPSRARPTAAPARRPGRSALAGQRHRARPRRAAADAVDAARRDRGRVPGDHPRSRRADPQRRRCAVDVDRFRRAAWPTATSEAAVGRVPRRLPGGLRLCGTRPAFEDWQRGQADTLRRELTAALAALAAGREAAGDWSAALVHVRRWLDARPAARAGASRADPAATRYRGDRAARAGPVPPVRPHALPRAGGFTAPRDHRALRGGQHGHADALAARCRALRTRRRTGGRQTPFVGRDDELRRCARLYDAIGHDGRVVRGRGRGRHRQDPPGRGAARDLARTAPPYWPAARTRTRRRWRTRHWSTRCGPGCARTPTGSTRSTPRALAEVARLLPEIAEARRRPDR